MKGGITKRLEQVETALSEGKLKKALSLTEGIPKLEQHHEWIADAARTCLTDKGNKKACEEAIKMATAKVKSTTELPEDDTSLEGLEQYLEPKVEKTEEATEKPSEEMSDEEAYEHCHECHIVDAVVKFNDIAEGCQDAEVIDKIAEHAKNEDTPPTEWMQCLIEVAEKPSCGQDKYKQVLGELSDYLQKEDSPILKEMDKGEED